jgi:hypothetical protein
MGWARTLFLGDWGNRLDIDDCEQQVRGLHVALRQQQIAERGTARRLARLERENGELKLYLAALVKLLMAKGVFDQKEFGRLVDIIDAADGETDGQYSQDLDL